MGAKLMGQPVFSKIELAVSLLEASVAIKYANFPCE